MASNQAREQVLDLLETIRVGDLQCAGSKLDKTSLVLYELLLSQTLPELIRHVFLLNRAMVEVGTRLYLKIGTTGTGGMGLNIPSTHSEGKPSAPVINQTAGALARTRPLFPLGLTDVGSNFNEV